MEKRIPDAAQKTADGNGGVIMRLKIGNVTLDNNLILAPMAGVTDLPFRLLCAQQGAGLVCMEMVSAKAIYYGNKKYERASDNPPPGEAGIPAAFRFGPGYHQ